MSQGSNDAARRKRLLTNNSASSSTTTNLPAADGALPSITALSLTDRASKHHTACMTSIPKIRALCQDDLFTDILFYIIKTSANGYLPNSDQMNKHHYIVMEIFYTGYRDEWLVAPDQAENELIRRYQAGLPTLPGCRPQLDGLAGLLAHAGKLLKDVADSHVEAYKRQREDLYLTFIISFLTRGSVTNEKLDMIRSDLTISLKRTPDIDTNLFAPIWRDISIINSEGLTVGMLAAWESTFSKARFPCIHILIEEAFYAGLRTYLLIKDTMSNVEGAPWAALYAVCAGNFLNFYKAMRVVRNRPYFAFQSEDQVADSTRFKSLGYAAYLIIKKVGWGTITDYPSFQNDTIPFKVEIDDIIGKWNGERRNRNDELTSNHGRNLARILNIAKR